MRVCSGVEDAAVEPIRLEDIPGSIKVQFGLPQPDWRVVHTWMKARIGEAEWAAAWDTVAEQWLRLLGSALGSEYKLRDEYRFYTLDGLTDREGVALARFANESLRVLEATFATLNRPNILGRRVVIFFGDRRSYYSYTAAMDRPGAWATSGGRYIPRGYRHTIVAPCRAEYRQCVVAHELTHHVLDHLRLPLWVEEGLAQMMEEQLARQSRFHLDRELVRRHREFWAQTGLTEFWLGKSYHDPEGQELSYNMAQVLVRRLAADHRKQFMGFVRDAQRGDAGEASAQRHLGIGLSEIVAGFLGPGDWSFRPPSGDERAPETTGSQVFAGCTIPAAASCFS